MSAPQPVVVGPAKVMAELLALERQRLELAQLRVARCEADWKATELEQALLLRRKAQQQQQQKPRHNLSFHRASIGTRPAWLLPSPPPTRHAGSFSPPGLSPPISKLASLMRPSQARLPWLLPQPNRTKSPAELFPASPTIHTCSSSSSSALSPLTTTSSSSSSSSSSLENLKTEQQLHTTPAAVVMTAAVSPPQPQILTADDLLNLLQQDDADRILRECALQCLTQETRQTHKRTDWLRLRQQGLLLLGLDCLRRHHVSHHNTNAQSDAAEEDFRLAVQEAQSTSAAIGENSQDLLWVDQEIKVASTEQLHNRFNTARHLKAICDVATQSGRHTEPTTRQKARKLIDFFLGLNSKMQKKLGLLLELQLEGPHRPTLVPGFRYTQTSKNYPDLESPILDEVLKLEHWLNPNVRVGPKLDEIIQKVTAALQHHRQPNPEPLVTAPEQLLSPPVVIAPEQLLSPLVVTAPEQLLSPPVVTAPEEKAPVTQAIIYDAIHLPCVVAEAQLLPLADFQPSPQLASAPLATDTQAPVVPLQPETLAVLPEITVVQVKTQSPSSVQQAEGHVEEPQTPQVVRVKRRREEATKSAEPEAAVANNPNENKKHKRHRAASYSKSCNTVHRPSARDRALQQELIHWLDQAGWTMEHVFDSVHESWLSLSISGLHSWYRGDKRQSVNYVRHANDAVNNFRLCNSLSDDDDDDDQQMTPKADNIAPQTSDNSAMLSMLATACASVSSQSVR